MTKLVFACTELFSTGGIQRFNRNLLEAWRTSGKAVVVLTLNDDAPPRWAELRYENIRFICCGRRKLRWCVLLVWLLLRVRPHHTVCAHLHLMPAVWLARILTGLKSSVTLILHGIEVWDRMTLIMRRASRACDRVLAVSTYTIDSFLSQVPGFPPERASVFPNTIADGLPEPGDRLPHPAGHIRLLSVSRLSVTERDKGIRDVLDALADIDGGNVEYVVVGDGDDRGDLMEYAESKGVAASFPGRLADELLWAEYQRADAFVLPSRKEGFGIVFLEAGYFGLPVIGAAEKGATDVITDGVNGMLVAHGDTRALRAAITSLRDDPDRCIEMGKAGRALVSGEGIFGFDAFCERTRRWLTTD